MHGFSTRRGGVSNCYGGDTLNLGLTPHDTRDHVEQNRRMFLDAVGAKPDNQGNWPLVQLKQIHSSVVHRVAVAPNESPAGDGLITDAPGLLLAVKTADCVPVLVADMKLHVVAAFHAGLARDRGPRGREGNRRDAPAVWQSAA